MKKQVVLWLILDLIFLIVFNVFFFVLGGTDHIASVWISYGFIHLSYLMLLLTPLLIRKGKSASIFGFSLYTIAYIYFLIELVTGIVFILLAYESTKAALLIQLVIAGLYGIIFVANMIANERTADADERHQDEILYVKNASMKLKGILDTIRDKDAKKNVERVYDAVYSSPVKSNPSLAQMENCILQSIDELENIAVKEDKEAIITSSIQLLKAVNERNMRLKSLN